MKKRIAIIMHGGINIYECGWADPFMDPEQCPQRNADPDRAVADQFDPVCGWLVRYAAVFQENEKICDLCAEWPCHMSGVQRLRGQTALCQAKAVCERCRPAADRSDAGRIVFSVQSYDRCLCAGMDECLVQEKILDRAPVCLCLSCSGNKIVSWRSLSDRYPGRDRGGVCTELSYI